MRILLLLLLAIGVQAQTPVDYNKWDNGNGQHSMRLGGAYSNYKDTDSTFAAINNTLITDGDSSYCNTSILKVRVKDNGQSTVRLTWGGGTYEVTQKPIKLVWLHSQTKNWVDVIPSLTWGTPTVEDNKKQWSFPGFKYSVIKRNVGVAHEIRFMPAFLDSALVLYNQRADSQYIYLGNVIEYSFMNVDDTTLLDIAEVSSKKLKTFLRHTFSIGKQILQYDGDVDTDREPIPIIQRWIKQGGKIYCIELVRMQKVKQLLEDEPTVTTIWHNAEVSLDITADIDMAYIYSYEPNNNWGNSYDAQLAMRYVGRMARVLIRFSALADSIDEYPGVVWDSGMITLDVRGSNTTYFGANDSLGVDWFRATTAWVEGTGDASDAGGVTWNSACDASGGDPFVDWTTDGGDMVAVGETGTDTLWLTAGMVRNAHDSIQFMISGATIADSMNNEMGLILRATRVIDTDANNYCKAVFNTNKETNQSYRPHLTVWYSEAPSSSGQVIIIQ